jgi:hypothetical protein
METRLTAMFSLFSKVNGYLAVHVLVHRILDLCIQMGHLRGGLHPRLIFLKRQCVWWRITLFHI